MRICENTKEYISMNGTNSAHEFTEGKLEIRVGGPGRIGLLTICR